MLLFFASISWASELHILEIGDSNTNATMADVLWSGQPVQRGWVYRHNGTSYPVYPAGASPSVGRIPYLIDVSAVDGGWYIRRGINGASTTWPGTIAGQWSGALSDVAALGSVPDVVELVFGANDAKTLAKATAYEANMTTLIDDIQAQWPDAEILILRERCTDAACASPYGYPYLRTVVYPAQDALDAAYASVHVVDGTVCALVDGIHWSEARAVAWGIQHGGQECTAGLVATAIAAAGP